MSDLPRDGPGEKEMRRSLPDYDNSEINDIIDERIHSERNRKILKRRLIDGICYEPLAEEFDLSVQQIKTIIYRGGRQDLQENIKQPRSSRSLDCGRLLFLVSYR